jgi:hypothetical protein
MKEIRRQKCANTGTSGFIDMIYDGYSLVPAQCMIKANDPSTMILFYL